MAGRTEAERAVVVVGHLGALAVTLGLAALDGSVEAGAADLLDDGGAELLLGACDLVLEGLLGRLLLRERLLGVGNEGRVEAHLAQAEQKQEHVRVAVGALRRWSARVPSCQRDREAEA